MRRASRTFGVLRGGPKRGHWRIDGAGEAMTRFRSLRVCQLISWAPAGTVVDKGKIVLFIRPAIRECDV